MKNYKLIINPFAETEIKEAREWYNSQKNNLGEEYLAEFKKTVLRIQSNPFQFPIIMKEIRKADTGRFPYSVFYYVNQSVINIFAVFHTSRNPMIWKQRFENK